MYELKKKIGKVLTSKSLGPGPRFMKKIIYRAAVSQRLRNTGLEYTFLYDGLGGWGVWGYERKIWQ